eukprot:TRINITY_DN109691_c0_g1_i1.p2 TRINITY_DN109691_c0_g1~~TRINITY_DN109691_c0_g1_i1.p2  ORF type:complete len:111 (-),score=10.39 TRINITY_DN109691_c0_g1_i1:980-1312(-)
MRTGVSNVYENIPSTSTFQKSLVMKTVTVLTFTDVLFNVCQKKKLLGRRGKGNILNETFLQQIPEFHPHTKNGNIKQTQIVMTSMISSQRNCHYGDDLSRTGIPNLPSLQ